MSENLKSAPLYWRFFTLNARINFEVSFAIFLFSLVPVFSGNFAAPLIWLFFAVYGFICRWGFKKAGDKNVIEPDKYAKSCGYYL